MRAYAKDVLEDLGYWVLEAASAENAIRIVAKKPRIDLLFTDVVLPGASGRELSDQIKRRYPHLPVLFTIGYTRNAIVHQAGSIPTFTCSASPTPSRNSPANCATCSTLDLKRACPLECAPLPMAVRG